MAPAGWYDDGLGKGLRYWDGAQWTEHYAKDFPATGTAEAPPQVQTETVGADEAAGPQQANSPHSEHETALETEPEDAVAPADVHAVTFNADSATTVQPLASRAYSPPQAPTGFGAKKKYIALLQQENDSLRSVVEKYGISDAIERQRRLDSLDSAVAQRTVELNRAEAELASLQSQIVEVRDRANLQELGLYDYEHPAEHSAELAARLEGLRSQIKETNNADRAISAAANFTFNNSAAQGRKMVAQYSRLMLRAYNVEAENCVKTVKAGNLGSATVRLQKARDQIAKTGSMLDIQVTDAYHRLRIDELKLAAQHLELLQQEKEAERERKAELREQAKVEAELRKEQERLQKEKTHYMNSMAALAAKGDQDGVARLQEKLDDVERAIEDVDFRAANIRAGYVYVISNLGAFGKNMVKIGMTRRLEPMERVKELSDASVPFHFDVHALFFSQDAVEIEVMLHREFAPQRVNKVNLRREFFNVTPGEVLEVLKTHSVEVIEFNPDQQAEEFRTSWPDISASSTA